MGKNIIKLSKDLGISPTLIYWYVKQGLLERGKIVGTLKTGGFDVRWDKEQENKIKQIRKLTRRGFNINQIKLKFLFKKNEVFKKKT